MTVMETARLRIRSRTVDDVEPIVAMDLDPLVRRYMGPPLDPDAHRAEVRRRILAGIGPWAVEWKDRPGILGLCGLSEFDGLPFGQIGWRFTSASWGQGIGTEAARAVLDHSFAEMGIDLVTTLVHPDNIASVRVAEKIGMKRDGFAEFRGVRQFFFSADAGDRCC